MKISTNIKVFHYKDNSYQIIEIGRFSIHITAREMQKILSFHLHCQHRLAAKLSRRMAKKCEALTKLPTND